MNARLNILLPVKNLDCCKQRLASVLTRQERQQLVLALLKKNLHTLITHFSQHDILVITPDHTVSALAEQMKVRVLVEPVAQGLNAAVEAGTRWSLAHGYQTQVVLAPDIADLNVNELQQLIYHASTATAVTIAAATDWGTNVLLTRPPNAIPFQYGPCSAKRMLLNSTQRGIACNLLHLPHLSLDIDTPDDLDRWQVDGQAYPRVCAG
jgi:2-phospho-L-lactate/phosphoenolpyruvate guanylyltransferase